MKLDTIDREEFDRRLEQSTARMRQQRLDLEARAAELEDLIGRYASVLERIEAESEQNTDPCRKPESGG
jgi:BMFP domain-containing protein YqiC